MLNPAIRHYAFALAAILLTAGHTEAQLSFDIPDFPTGNSPVQIAYGDFNHDGIPDIVTVNHQSHTISILLGRRDGTFGPRTDYLVGSDPWAIVAADLNGDGIGDIAVVDRSDGVVSTFFGKGDGTFGTKTDSVVGPGGNSMVVADFNGDGILDLAVAVSKSNIVSVLLGRGDGTFRPKADFNAGKFPTSLVSGDFNHDGKTDLAVVNGGPGSVSILLARGDGTFHPPLSIDVLGATSIGVADFNNDGKEDLLIGFRDCGFLECSDKASVYLGNGDGTFSATGVSYDTFGNFGIDDLNGDGGNFTIADLNGDGKADFAVTNAFIGVSVFLGKGNGTFSLVNGFINPTGESPGALLVADFNGDKHSDLAVANSGDSTVSLLLGNGDGTFRSRRRFDLSDSAAADFRGGAPENPPRAIVSVDLNRDGLRDLAVAHANSGKIDILLSKGDGTFTQGQSIASIAGGSDACALTAADFNGDGVPDLAFASADLSGVVVVLLNNGDGTFQAPLSFPTGAIPCSVAVGDFNEDGIQDLAVGNSGSGTVSILLGNGNGTFQPKRDIAVGGGPIAVTDFNLDGHLDLAVANQVGGTVSVLYGLGYGTFNPPQILLSGRDPTSIVSADFNGDGIPDLAVANSADNQVAVFFGLRMGLGFGWSSRTLYDTGVSPRVVVSGDFDGDRITDLAVLNDFAETLSILRGNRDGTFRPKLDFLAGVPSPIGLVTGDFNSDGRADLAVLDEFALSILFNTSTGTPSGCDAPTTFGVLICEPANDATDGTSVHIAAAANVPNFALLRVYENNQNIYDTTSSSLDVNLGLSPGVNHLVLVAYDGKTGQAYTDERFVSSSGSGAAICSSPATDRTIDICYPNENNNTGATFQLQARARWDNNVITHMRVYVDNQPAYDEDVPKNGYINPVVTVSVGKHQIVVVAWNLDGMPVVSPTRTALFFQ